MADPVPPGPAAPERPDVEKIRERLAKVTPGKWFYDSYSRVDAADFILAEDEWEGEYGPEYYDKVMSTIAWVPAKSGDTATGRHAADAEFIAHAPADVAFLLAEVGRLQRCIRSLVDAGDDVADLAPHLATAMRINEHLTVDNLRNMGRNIASIGRAALSGGTRKGDEA